MRTYTPGFLEQLARGRGARPLWLLHLVAGEAINVAAAANGGVATASSEYGSISPASQAIDGDWINWAGPGTYQIGWVDGTVNDFPDWLRVDFAASSTINRVVVISAQDNEWAPVYPTADMLFTVRGMVDFDVQYWDGSGWVTVPGGEIRGNNLVLRTVTFAPVTTTAIRIYCLAAGAYSRIVEVEAWSVPARDCWISDQVVTIEGWESSSITTLAWVDSWGEISELLTGDTNEIRIADVSITLKEDPDDPENIVHLVKAHDLETNPCSIWIWFLDLDIATDPPQELLRGYVLDPKLPDTHTVQVLISDEAHRLDADYGTVLSQEQYPDCLANHVGRLLPVVFGTVTRVMPPVAKIDATYFYYVFGCVLDSISSVLRVETGGTYTELYPGSVAFWTGKTGDELTGFEGKAVVRCPKQTVTTVWTNTTDTLPAPVIASPSYGTDYSGGWSSITFAFDASDTTFAVASGLGPYVINHTWTSPGTMVRVRFRAKLTCSYAGGFTVVIKNQSGTTRGTANFLDVAEGTVIETAWFSAPGDTALTAIVTFPAVGGVVYHYYRGWLDVEYSVATGTTTSDNAIDIQVTGTRATCTYGDLTNPAVMASDILGQPVICTCPILPASYIFGGAITESKRIIDWLNAIAFQCRSWFRISRGSARLIWRDLPADRVPVATIAALSTENSVAEWSQTRVPRTQVVNYVRLRYSRDWTRTGAEAYQAICTRTNDASIKVFGIKDADTRFMMDFVSQPTHAVDLAEFYAAVLGARPWQHDGKALVEYLGVEYGDTVELPDGSTGEVVSSGVQPGTIEVMDKLKLTVLV